MPKGTSDKEMGGKMIRQSYMTSQEAALLRQIARGKFDAKPQDADTLTLLIRRGAIISKDGMHYITPEGRQAMRRHLLRKEEDQIYAAQHQWQEICQTGKDDQSIRADDVPRPDKSAGQAAAKVQLRSSVRVKRAESPLQQLASRTRTDGSRYLTVSQIQAGERLRSDFERGQLAGKTGINWDRLGETAGATSRNARVQNSSECLSGGALDARQRFRKAMSHVGEEFADPLIDFCCFLKGLEDIERSRQWPARSAKQILAMGLSCLARHYGLSDKTEGPQRNRIEHWGTDDYRPSIR
ncbi:DUF6456 domain-containing protein [uncultured Cohaesibacter sp.]|uniref:DUF6456 domain-containing protein n=1 Tax=uncultured Cohaesibacter sp. TaxID=1002546 RepID=UPI00292D7B41|nr:DUF6456 domain-containing protein [uncultured Cohaesibacter sp.]